MTGSAAGPWYQSKGFVWAALTLGGVFGLPFLWMSPHFSQRSKIIITVTTVILAILLARFMMALFELLQRELNALREAQSGI